MDVINDYFSISYDVNTVVSVGTFDGVHQGHQEIIRLVKNKASLTGGRSVIVTFDPHPRSVLQPESKIGLLLSKDEKIEAVANLGIDILFFINFTKEFSQLTADDFLNDIIVKKIGLKEIIIGHDHHFGRNRSGNEEFLQKLATSNGFNVSIVPPVSYNGITISSSKIRKALLDGNVMLAAQMLGRDYSFSSIVVDGDKRGRKIGFPTANLSLIDKQKIVPAIGVYAVKVVYDNMEFLGVMNIGKRPTFVDSDEVVLEVHILNFDKTIYGEELKIIFVDRIRGEKKFNSVEELVNEINNDIKFWNK